ncbi:MAG: allantoinase AllB [Sporichthyaceae bacterium]
MDLVFLAERVVTADGKQPAAVGVQDGRIVAVAPVDAGLVAHRTVELADDEVLLPGLVDTHVHINEPGRTEWEGFATATRAAAAGGVTTVIDMPLNSIPPTTDVAALEVKRAAARDTVHVDVGFWGGAVPDNLGELAALHTAGVFGFKCFLAPSGVDEFPHLSTEQLAAALTELKPLDALMIVHAEDCDVLESSAPPTGDSYVDFLASRPVAAEVTAVTNLVDQLRRTGGRGHVLHLSGAAALPVLTAARDDGVRVSAETCPHYLALSAEDVPTGATQFKCCPPIRDQPNREELWQGLRSGAIDCVVSDHSPCTADLKCLDSGDFGLAWGGIASLQLGLPVVWTQARARGVELSEVVRWMSSAPARLAGLRRKGSIAVGADADLCVFAPDESWVVDATRLQHRNPVTPYDGANLRGVARSTWLHGAEVTGDAPAGRLLRRDTDGF